MLDRSGKHRHIAKMLGFLATCGSAFAAYALFAGSLSVSEAATGAVLAVLVAIWRSVADRARRHRFAFSAAHLRVWARAFRNVPKQTAVTAVALIRVLLGRDGEPGRADERPFRLGASQDPRERARRASAVLAASLAPASYVVEVGPDRDRALLHAITATPAPHDPEWLA